MKMNFLLFAGHGGESFHSFAIGWPFNALSDTTVNWSGGLLLAGYETIGCCSWVKVQLLLFAGHAGDVVTSAATVYKVYGPLYRITKVINFSTPFHLHILNIFIHFSELSKC
jgi:hypothetical protein